MRVQSVLAVLVLSLSAAGWARADEQPPIPVPDAPAAEGAAPAAAAPITLYACVKVDDADEIHPCAEKTIVSVADPCNPCCCRYVEICVPPCGCPRIKASKCGTRVTYYYGEYKVELKSKRDYVEVEYHD